MPATKASAVNKNSIGTLLEEATSRLAQNSDTPKADAEILLAAVLDKSRAYLRSWQEQHVPEQLVDVFNDHVARRSSGEPIAYILGLREFWSRDFNVSQHTLIPRPETELLVEHALARLPKNEPLSVIDLGTGAGVIAITVALERPHWSITACDVSVRALDVAKSNADRLGASNVRFLASDWFAALGDCQFDAVLANPPYIDPDDAHLKSGDLRFEPPIALSCGNRGLEALLRISTDARRYLTHGGVLILEHGFDQGTELISAATRLGYHDVVDLPDLSGTPRTLLARWLHGSD